VRMRAQPPIVLNVPSEQALPNRNLKAVSWSKCVELVGVLVSRAARLP